MNTNKQDPQGTETGISQLPSKKGKESVLSDVEEAKGDSRHSLSTQIGGYLPKTMIMIPAIEALHTPHL